MQVYKATIKNGRLNVVKANTQKLKLIYNSMANNCIIDYGKGKKRIPSTKIDTYTPVKVLFGKMMFFTSYHAIDMKQMKAAFAKEFIEGTNETIEVLENDILLLRKMIYELEKLL